MRPVLGPLHTETAPIKGLDGIRVSVRLTLISDDSSVRDTRDMRDTCDMRDACDTRDTCTSFSEVGELLFRDFGISGIVAFNLSRHARVGDQLAIDFFPEYDLETLTALLRRRGELLGPLTERSYFDGLVHPRIGQLLAATATATTTATTTAATAATSAAAAATTTTSSTFVSASDPQPQALAGALKDWRLRMVGGPRPEQAQVTRGGYAVEDFDPHSLQSCAQPGLYAAGECLDVDGPCGGFNLHWAWVSGIVAGRAAATTASATATTSASAATPSHR
jgi:predicted flavoprotein YhiN